ncbi:MAG: UDP-2,3-diacylglucosamine diphosphatase LpxI [Candidatus Aminicenantes bacterium]|nr:UDP-2,3-diacylglucosamine diphosphatase LpxI [Candidatus Aminicenantes bacterium]
MGPRFGLIAGSGELPLLALEEAAARGWVSVVAGVRGEASRDLEQKAGAFLWFDPGRPEEAVRFLKDRGVESVLLAGKVDPRASFRRPEGWPGRGERPAGTPEGTPSALILAFIRYLESRGLRVMDPAPFLSPHFCAEGVLTAVQPPGPVLEDAHFGWALAKRMADLDVGQTVIVKTRTVAAVEAAEGTDAAIRRAAALAGPGTVAVKVGRTRQDLRIDVPGVGLSTIRTLIEAEAAALCLEAGRVAFFQRQEALDLADKAGLAVFARKGTGKENG